MFSSVKRTSRALTEVFIPSPFNQIPIRLNDDTQFANSTRPVTIIVGQFDRWIQPKLRFHTAPLNVDVHRFARRTLVGIKEKPESALAKDVWHVACNCKSDLWCPAFSARRLRGRSPMLDPFLPPTSGGARQDSRKHPTNAHVVEHICGLAPNRQMTAGKRLIDGKQPQILRLRSR
jgi:hypothetical protein